MFTGLIQKVGKVKRVSRGRGLVLEFQFEPWPEPLVKGESVAVNGVCLTVCDSDATRFTADVLGETERRTGLAELCPGAKVNLERAMRAGKTIVLTTQVQNEGSNVGVYQVGYKIRSCPQILEAFDMTTEAIVGKLMWILGQTQTPEEIHRLFYTPVANDILSYQNRA